MATETRKFSDELRARPDYLAFQQDIPDTTNADGNGGARLVGKVQGALEVVARAYEDISITGTVTVKLQESTTETGSFTDVAGASVAVVNPTTAAGAEFARFAINRNVGPWIKVNIASTATPTTGKLNVYPAYLAR